MEPWRHTSEGKSPFQRDGELLMGWKMKPSCNSYNMFGLSREEIGNTELGFPEMVRKSNPTNPSLDALGGENASFLSTSNPSLEELESRLSFSTPFIVSNTQKSSLIDLELGKFSVWREAKNSEFSQKRSVFSSVASSLCSKRARTMNLYSQNPVCQVHGCNKDLSSSKDYHKRHKVCDVHSKTATVIVNGIEQRFCQQCSRFHLLAEFDQGKRSCRKRLVGHNERRRKPQLDTLWGKPQQLLQFYEGAGFLRPCLPKRSSFVSPGMLPCEFFNQQENVRCNQSSQIIKVEDGPMSSPQFPMPTGNYLGKEFPSGKFSLQTDYPCLQTLSSKVELSNSSSVPSLLSAQSQNLSSHLTGIPMVSPRGVNQESQKFVGVNIGEKLSPHGFCSSSDFDQLEAPVIFGEVQAGGIFQRSDSVRDKSCFCSGNGPTVDLVPLSSYLRRVEQQRNSMQAKQ